MYSTSSREIVRISQYVKARILVLEFTTGLLGSMAKFSPNESPFPERKKREIIDFDINFRLLQFQIFMTTTNPDVHSRYGCK